MPPPMTKEVKAVIEAMRDVQTETDRWKLAEALLVAVPKGGDTAFGPIVDAAVMAKVDGTGYKTATLRLYRDTARQWPEADRIPGVSFTAHREVQNAKELGSMADKRKTLEGLAQTQGGPGKVTVASIRRAVALKAGQTPAAQTPRGANPIVADTVNDLKDGGTKLIAAIPKGTSADDLDKIKKGLNAVLAHVEQLAVRAKREAAAAKAKASAPSDAEIHEQTKKVAAAAKKQVGDLRGLR
jgi:hypothetical protein